MGIFSKKEPVPEYKRPIMISTGNLLRSYEIIDAVFAVEINQETWFKAADPSKSFEGVKEQLKDKCRALDGDAVICCQFQYRISVDPGIVSKQAAEIWAYGTAVRFTDD